MGWGFDFMAEMSADLNGLDGMGYWNRLKIIGIYRQRHMDY